MSADEHVLCILWMILLQKLPSEVCSYHVFFLKLIKKPAAEGRMKHRLGCDISWSQGRFAEVQQGVAWIYETVASFLKYSFLKGVSNFSLLQMLICQMELYTDNV
jgi:hypothetical protein